MDFSLSEDQRALRELARKMLDELATHERLKAVKATSERIDRELWRELAKANLLGVAIEERFGGNGTGLTELAIVLEEIGRAVAPVPIYPTLVLGALPIAAFGSETLRAKWATKIDAEKDDEAKQAFKKACQKAEEELNGAVAAFKKSFT